MESGPLITMSRRNYMNKNRESLIKWSVCIMAVYNVLRVNNIGVRRRESEGIYFRNYQK